MPPDCEKGRPLAGHLLPVTPRINTLRGRSFSAINFRKTHCGTCGTEYDLLNTHFHRGRRDCRACGRRRVAKYKARLRQGAELAAELGRAA